jgi:hypothetical protein
MTYKTRWCPRMYRDVYGHPEGLHQGPATNREPAGLSLKYTSRLSDLRAAGYDVRVVERDYATGRTVYKLGGIV